MLNVHIYLREAEEVTSKRSSIPLVAVVYGRQQAGSSIYYLLLLRNDQVQRYLLYNILHVGSLSYTDCQ